MYGIMLNILYDAVDQTENFACLASTLPSEAHPPPSRPFKCQNVSDYTTLKKSTVFRNSLLSKRQAVKVSTNMWHEAWGIFLMKEVNLWVTVTFSMCTKGLCWWSEPQGLWRPGRHCLRQAKQCHLNYPLQDGSHHGSFSNCRKGSIKNRSHKWVLKTRTT